MTLLQIEISPPKKVLAVQIGPSFHSGRRLMPDSKFHIKFLWPTFVAWSGDNFFRNVRCGPSHDKRVAFFFRPAHSKKVAKPISRTSKLSVILISCSCIRRY
jgi:hypothetical protein